MYKGGAHPETRIVERPRYEELLADLETMSVLAVGRKYGVSDNAVRKWLKWYARQAERDRSEGGDGEAIRREAA